MTNPAALIQVQYVYSAVPGLHSQDAAAMLDNVPVRDRIQEYKICRQSFGHNTNKKAAAANAFSVFRTALVRIKIDHTI